MNAAKRSIVTVLDDVGRVATSLTWDNCRSTGASTAVPVFLDPVASRPITVVWRHRAGLTAVRTVPEPMAPDLDGVARFDVLSLDADPLEPRGTGRFESPGRRLLLIVLDFQVDPGMRDQQVDFRDRPLHRRPLRYVVVTVGMMRPDRQHGKHRTCGRKAQGSDQHGPSFMKTLTDPHSRLGRPTVIWRAGVTGPGIAIPPHIRSCSNFDSELASPPHQGIGGIAETAPALVHGEARSPRGDRDECHACGSRRRYEIHRRW